MEDPDCKFPTACEHDMLSVWGIDLTKMSYQDILRLLEYGFIPGMDDEFSVVLEYVGEGNGWDDLTEEDWLQLRTELSSCVHSYEYGSC